MASRINFWSAPDAPEQQPERDAASKNQRPEAGHHQTVPTVYLSPQDLLNVLIPGQLSRFAVKLSILTRLSALDFA